MIGFCNESIQISKKESRHKHCIVKSFYESLISVMNPEFLWSFKVMGSLADKKCMQDQRVSGILVKKNFSYHILAPSDLSSEMLFVITSGVSYVFECPLLTPVLFFLMMQITLIWPWAQWNRLKPSPSPALSPCFWVSYGTWQVCIPVCLCVLCVKCGAHRVCVLGDVEEIEISEKSTLRVFNGITVVHDQNMVLLEVRRHTGHSHTSVTMATEVTRVLLCVCVVFFLQWFANPLNDMYADAVTTVVLEVQSNPKAQKGEGLHHLQWVVLKSFPPFSSIFLFFYYCFYLFPFLVLLCIPFCILSPFVAFFLSFSWFWWLPLFVSFLFPLPFLFLLSFWSFFHNLFPFPTFCPPIFSTF